MKFLYCFNLVQILFDLCKYLFCLKDRQSVMLTELLFYCSQIVRECSVNNAICTKVVELMEFCVIKDLHSIYWIFHFKPKRFFLHKKITFHNCYCFIELNLWDEVVRRKRNSNISVFWPTFSILVLFNQTKFAGSWLYDATLPTISKLLPSTILRCLYIGFLMSTRN